MTTRTIRKILMYVSAVAWVIWLSTNIILFKSGDSPRWSTVFILFLICFIYIITDIIRVHMDDIISDLRERLVFKISIKTQKEYKTDNIGPAGGYIFMQHDDGTYVECWTHDESKEMSWNKAREYVKTLNYGGYSDWFLPTKEELDEIYMNKDQIGNFRDDYYWSDTEYSKCSAWTQKFSTGSQLNLSKYSSRRVRAIRRSK